MGGDSCFACAAVGRIFGFTPLWYIHPADKSAPPGTVRKPLGRQHGYLHQVIKCPYALAFAHRRVRSDRDSGRDDGNARIFQERPFA